MAAESLAFILQIMLENILPLPLLPNLLHPYSLFRCQSKSHCTLEVLSLSSQVCSYYKSGYYKSLCYCLSVSIRL